MTSTHDFSRRIRHARFRAPSEEQARRAATLLEDALRTASLPEADGGRLIVIRRLALGRIDPAASSATVALSIERAMREAILSAVPAASPSAAEANIVQFRDRTEILSLLARRLALRLPATEWFWPAALLKWVPEKASPASWPKLLGIAHSFPVPSLAAAAVIREAIVNGALAELVPDLPEGIGLHWLRLGGFATSPDPVFESVAFHEPQIETALLTIVQNFSTPDDRLLWLVTIGAVADNPRRAGDPMLPARAQTWIAGIRRKIHPVEAVPKTKRESSFLPRDPNHPADHVAVTARGPHHEFETLSLEIPKQKSERRTPSPLPSPRPEPFRLQTERTQFGGLFFVLAALGHLGFPGWLSLQPTLIERGFGAAMLAALANHLQPGHEDPLIPALDPPFEFQHSPLPLPRIVGELLSHPPAREQHHQPLGPWIGALRRWCRRRARIGLHSLVMRPARFSSSRTHLDLYFALEQADLRVRRAGLDLDPGWVPWLGRIIRFHYNDNARG